MKQTPISFRRAGLYSGMALVAVMVLHGASGGITLLSTGIAVMTILGIASHTQH